MKSLNIKFGIALLTIATLAGCSDFLDQKPESARSVDNAYKSATDFNNAVIGAYASFKLTGLFANGGTTSGLLMLSDGASDSWDIGQTRNSITLYNYEIEEFNISLSNTLVTAAWQDHYIAIGRVNTILDKLPGSTASDDLKKKYEGEARFLRAYFYFNLTRLFGDVPLILNSVTSPYAANGITRTASATVYETIVSDLQVAENNLPDALAATEQGRASKWVAKGLLGKVYLTQQNYAAASTKLAEVIASGKFSVAANTYPAVFNFATAFDVNKDVMLAVQYKTGQVSQGSALWSAMIPFGAPGTLFGTTSTGEGYMRPTAEMISTYEAGDLRQAASVATSYVNGAATINERYNVKYRQSGPISGDSDEDFPILRYADVLLMNAEALNEQNQTASAYAFINPVRQRAGLAPLSGLTQDAMRLAIEKERRVELLFEGHRWFDLVRTDRYLTVMNSKGYLTKAFHKLYPVPQRETDLNGALGQNPGY